MYYWKQYGNIGLALFSKSVTMEELSLFAEDVTKTVEGTKDLFVIGIPMPGTQFPKHIRELATVVDKLKQVKSMVKRYYGVRQDIITSFIANTISTLFGIRDNTIEADNLEDLYATLLKEAEIFPALKASIENLDAIKQDIEAHRKQW